MVMHARLPALRSARTHTSELTIAREGELLSWHRVRPTSALEEPESLSRLAEIGRCRPPCERIGALLECSAIPEWQGGCSL